MYLIEDRCCTHQTADPVIFSPLIEEYWTTRLIEVVDNLVLLLECFHTLSEMIDLLLPKLCIGIVTLQREPNVRKHC